jgi:hypothetical protein
MGKQTDKIKSLTEAFPQLSEVEAKQLLEVHGSLEDATSAVIEEESKWSKVKTPAAKIDKKDKASKHKTPAGVAAAAPRDASPRGDRPPREPRAPRGDIPEPVKKVAPKVEATMKIEIGSAAKVANGMSFLDMLKKKSAPPAAAAAPATEEEAPAAKKADNKKEAKASAPVEDEAAHDPSQDPPAPTQSQAAAAASPEVAPAAAEEPVAKKERVKKPKAPKPAKVEPLYFVPQVETSEILSFPDHVLARPIDESVKFISNPGEAPAPPAVAQPVHQHMAGVPPHHQQRAYGGGYNAPNGYGRMNNAPQRQHVSQWSGQEGQASWHNQHSAPVRREPYQQQQPRPAQYQQRNDFRGNGVQQPADTSVGYNMRGNNTWGN